MLHALLHIIMQVLVSVKINTYCIVLYCIVLYCIVLVSSAMGDGGAWGGGGALREGGGRSLAHIGLKTCTYAMCVQPVGFCTHAHTSSVDAITHTL